MGVEILGYGTYIPKYRISREEIAKAWAGKGTGDVSVSQANEDVYTMAAEACINAINCSGVSPEQVDALYFASSSASYVEHTVIKAVSEVLRLRGEVELSQFSSSQHAGAAALKASLDAVNSGRINYVLVVAADCRAASPGSDEERNFAAGAGAFLLGCGPGRASFGNFNTASTYIIDNWRSNDGKYVNNYDPRFTREYGYTNQIVKSVLGLMQREYTQIGDYAHVIIPPHTDQRVFAITTKELGVKDNQVEKTVNLNKNVGDTGTAAFFLSMAAILDQAKSGEKVLGTFYGSGIAETFSITVTGEHKAADMRSLDKYIESKEYVSYLDFLKTKKVLAGEQVLPTFLVSPLSPQWYRDGDSIRRFIGAKCKKCGYVNFPATGRKICIRCGGLDFEPVLRKTTGKIHTYCINIYGPSGLESPLPVIIADMDDGTRFKALGTEFKMDEISIELSVELVWRKVTEDKGANGYIYFFRPLR